MSMVNTITHSNRHHHITAITNWVTEVPKGYDPNAPWARRAVHLMPPNAGFFAPHVQRKQVFNEIDTLADIDWHSMNSSSFGQLWVLICSRALASEATDPWKWFLDRVANQTWIRFPEHSRTIYQFQELCTVYYNLYNHIHVHGFPLIYSWYH